MSLILIDHSGNIWPARLEVVARHFRLGNQHNWLSWAIASGFIFVALGEWGARVALRPHFVTREAESRLYTILSKRTPARVAISRDARLTSWELVIGAESAIVRIVQLIAEAREPSPRPLLTAQLLPLDRCLDIAGGQLFPVLQAWEQRQGRWEPELYGHMRESGLLATTAIARRPRGSERLLIEHWGEGITSYGQDWIRIARGRDFEDQPNAELGRWDAIRQKQTLAEGVPKLSKLDFVFCRIDGELVRVSFDRLGLPWWTSDEEAIVTSVTTRRRMIVLERPNPTN
jgi:hypothetical protein